VSKKIVICATEIQIEKIAMRKKYKICECIKLSKGNKDKCFLIQQNNAIKSGIDCKKQGKYYEKM